MTEQYTPTTEEVREVWEYHLSEGMASEAVKYDANWDTDRLLAQFDRWLAEHDRQVAEKAYERGRRDERHDYNRFQEYLDGLLTEAQLKNNLRSRNPYRKVEQS